MRDAALPRRALRRRRARRQPARSDWPATLRGTAARVYLRWRDEMKPEGFRLSAQVVSFPDGLPGDVELSLIWGG